MLGGLGPGSGSGRPPDDGADKSANVSMPMSSAVRHSPQTNDREKDGGSKQQTRQQATRTWRDRPSYRHKANDDELDKIVNELRRHLNPMGAVVVDRMVHTLRVEKRDAFEMDAGHGRYQLWLAGVRFNSIYQFARHFCPALPDKCHPGKRRKVPEPAFSTARAFHVDDDEASTADQIEHHDANDDAIERPANDENTVRHASTVAKKKKQRSVPLTADTQRLLRQMQKQIDDNRKENERRQKKIEKLQRENDVLRASRPPRRRSSNQKNKNDDEGTHGTRTLQVNENATGDEVPMEIEDGDENGGHNDRNDGANSSNGDRVQRNGVDGASTERPQNYINDDGDDGFDGVFDSTVGETENNPPLQQLLDRLGPPVVTGDVTVENVEELLDRSVPWHGEDKPLRDICNFDATSIHEAFTFRGATLATSIEQSAKTNLMAALSGLCVAKRRPCILVCALQRAQVQELTGKLEGVLMAMGIATTFLDNAEGAWRCFKEDRAQVAAFKQGKRLVVMPAYAMARVSLVDEVDARDVLVMLDESDEVFTRDDWRGASKEDTFARVIGKPHLPDSRVTGVVFVSATHLADLHVLNKALSQVPKAFVCVDVEELRRKGFTTHEDMQLYASVAPEFGKKEYQHGLTSPAFAALMDDFKTCPGRRKLMLVASSPRVNAGDSTLFTQADKVLEYDPEALVVVHFTGKCFLKYRQPNGVVKEVQMKKSGNPSAASRSKRKVHPIKTVNEALEELESKFAPRSRDVNVANTADIANIASTSSAPPVLPPVESYATNISADNIVNDRRFVVIGYNALSRSTSTRTKDMVPTHMFVLLGKGRHSADLRQTMMRPAGKSTDVRRANGHGHVKVVAPENDWYLIQALYGFQNSVCERTTEDPSFDFESHKNYGARTRPVLESERPHTRPALKLSKRWEANPSPESDDEYRDERRRSQKDLRDREKVLFRRLQRSEDGDDSEEDESRGDVGSRHRSSAIEEDAMPNESDGNEEVFSERLEDAGDDGKTADREMRPHASASTRKIPHVPIAIPIDENTARAIISASNNDRTTLARTAVLKERPDVIKTLEDGKYEKKKNYYFSRSTRSSTLRNVDAVIAHAKNNKTALPIGVPIDSIHGSYYCLIVDVRDERSACIYVMYADVI